VVSARRLRTLQSVPTVPSVRVFLCIPSYLSPMGSKAGRTINAPAERVFEALTNPDQRVKWWGAAGRFQTTHMESFCIATQALRTWLLSCCPSGTKHMHPPRHRSPWASGNFLRNCRQTRELGLPLYQAEAGHPANAA
jgi:hypothetical protein